MRKLSKITEPLCLPIIYCNLVLLVAYLFTMLDSTAVNCQCIACHNNLFNADNVQSILLTKNDKSTAIPDRNFNLTNHDKSSNFKESTKESHDQSHKSTIATDIHGGLPRVRSNSNGLTNNQEATLSSISSAVFSSTSPDVIPPSPSTPNGMRMIIGGSSDANRSISSPKSFIGNNVTSSNLAKKSINMAHNTIKDSNDKEGFRLIDNDHEELNILRTEFFKHRILNELGLSSEPRVDRSVLERGKSLIDDVMISLSNGDLGGGGAVGERLELKSGKNIENPVKKDFIHDRVQTKRHDANDRVILFGSALQMKNSNSSSNYLGSNVNNVIEFYLTGSHLLSIMMKLFSSVKLFISLSKTTPLAVPDNQNNKNNESQTKYSHDELHIMKNNLSKEVTSSYVRLILEQVEPKDKPISERYITLEPLEIRHWPYLRHTDILIDNVSSSFTKFNIARNSIGVESMKDSHMDNSSIGLQNIGSDGYYIERQVSSQIELMPSFMSALRPLGNPITIKMGAIKADKSTSEEKMRNNIYQDIILSRGFKYKLILLPPVDYVIESAYLSLNDEGSGMASLRYRRSLDCGKIKDSRSACCREPFFINFTDIGWDKWILHPPGYHANYCKGRCDLSHARFPHSSMLDKFSNLISLCCSPKKMSGLTLLYVDHQSLVHQRTMPDMTVESCDCS